MIHSGRAKSIVSWGILGLACLAGLGCSVSINTGNTRPQPAMGSDPVVTPPPAADGFQPANYRPTLIPGEVSRMPTGPEPVADVRLHPPTPNGNGTGGCPGCVDANVALPPGMKGYQGKGGFPDEAFNALPKELHKVTHPPYLLEPPDIILINAGRLVPRPPYVIQGLDTIIIQATETFPNQPINGVFTVGPDGRVSLGFGYGSVKVIGLTLEAARLAIQRHLSTKSDLMPSPLLKPAVSLGLAALPTVQQVQGEHLVQQDGTIHLGVYGCVYVAGMTKCQAQTVIEAHLAQFFQDPELSLDVFAYNSKAYYVIFDGGGYGQQVLKFPITGNETVLDAIYNAGGLPAVSSKRRMWVARPTPANHECVQILPVDWLAIVQSGSTRTNYQLFPGDRVYVKADGLIWLDNTMAKILAPVERLFGITLLGTSVVNQFRNNGNGRNNNNNGTAFITGF